MEKKFQEPLMVTCTLPSPTDSVKHKISCINLHSNVKISKCMLGFESESRLFKSQRLQAALAYCHKNVESWYREVRLAPNLEQEPNKNNSANCNDDNDYVNDDKINEDVMTEGNECNASSKQLITKEVIDKFHKPKKWYKHFKLLGHNNEQAIVKQNEQIDGADKVKSIDRYKDMSKLIEEKFGKKSYNPVKKSASFMFSSKRIDFEDSKSQNKNNPALLKCQSLDMQLHSMEEKIRERSKEYDNSKISISNSYNFRMCILDNENKSLETKSKNSFIKREPQSLRDIKPVSLQITETDLDEIKSVEETKLKKSKPDLIPTLTKDNSFITDRLCSEFHVKSRVQKRSALKTGDKLRSSCRIDCSTNFSLLNPPDAESDKNKHKIETSIVVQVHETSKQHFDTDDIPYSKVVDEISQKPSTRKPSDENIYAEICENSCNCVNNKNCDCKRTKKNSEYCYVKLGSNGESITSDSDEAIYNTLR